MLALLTFLTSAAIALWDWVRRSERPSKRAMPGVIVASLLILVSSWPIVARNFGRWDLLRQRLRDYSAVAAAYEQAHGRIRSNEDAKRFYELHPVADFDLGPRDDDYVNIVYLWWLQPGRAGIQWGRGGTAAFDLTTMFCVYSD